MKKLVRVCVLAGLLSSFAVADDHGNTTSSATRVNLSSITNGRIERGGDIDVFKFTLSGSARVSIFTQGSTDTYGYLFRGRSLVAQNDDTSATNRNFRIQRELSAGTYYVAIRGYSRYTTGAYQLRIENSSSPQPRPRQPRDDHGDSISSATAVNANSSTHGRLERSGDNDYFRIHINSAGRLEVGTSSSIDTYGYLLNSRGNIITTNDDFAGGRDFKITKTLSAGTYYIRVKGYSRNTTGSYSLRSSFKVEDNIAFPVSEIGWSHTSGSPYHRRISYAGLNFDDRYALDLNLNVPNYNKDKGMSVKPVAPGIIIKNFKALGFILVKHTVPLRLNNGTVYNTWYSGYMHMSDTTNGINVNHSTVLGKISRVGATNDHLHFSIYVYRNGRFNSINIRNNISAIANHVSHWY